MPRRTTTKKVASAKKAPGRRRLTAKAGKKAPAKKAATRKRAAKKKAATSKKAAKKTPAKKRAARSRPPKKSALQVVPDPADTEWETPPPPRRRPPEPERENELDEWGRILGPIGQTVRDDLESLALDGPTDDSLAELARALANRLDNFKPDEATYTSIAKELRLTLAALRPESTDATDEFTRLIKAIGAPAS